MIPTTPRANFNRLSDKTRLWSFVTLYVINVFEAFRSASSKADRKLVKSIEEEESPYAAYKRFLFYSAIPLPILFLLIFSARIKVKIRFHFGLNFDIMLVASSNGNSKFFLNCLRVGPLPSCKKCA